MQTTTDHSLDLQRSEGRRHWTGFLSLAMAMNTNHVIMIQGDGSPRRSSGTDSVC